MSQLLAANNELVKERNAYALQKIYDKLGVDRAVIVGTKSIKSSSQNIEDDLVWFPYRDRAVSLYAGSEGGGKTVTMEWVAYQLSIIQNSPIFSWDVQKQMKYLSQPLMEKQAIVRLKTIGIQPEGLRVLTFEPSFTHFNDADKSWALKLKDFVALSEYEGHSNFFRLLSKEELSAANIRAADAMWNDLQDFPAENDMEFLMDSYNRHYEKIMSDEKRLGGTIGKSIYATLIQMKMLRVFEGVRLDFKEMINKNLFDVYAFISSFANSNDSFSYYQTVYSIYLASMLHDYRRRKIIPRITKIRDEVDEALKTQESDVIAREIKKDRVEQNNLLYALQYIADANKEMIGSSDAIISTRVRSERDLELLMRKNPNDYQLKQLLHLETKTTPMQFAVVTYDSVQACYPFAPPMQFHKTDKMAKPAT